MFQKLLDKMKVTKETYENEFAEMFGKKAIGIDLFEIGEKILINAYGEMETDADIQNTINEVVFEYSGNEGIISFTVFFFDYYLTDNERKELKAI